MDLFVAVAMALDGYLTAKKRKNSRKEQIEIKDVALPIVIIWIAIAILLY